jgi:SPP1 family predicted phage head-tail adaptor
MTMRSGAMDRKIVIKEVTEVRTSVGGFSETLTPYATAWAELKPMSSRERFQSSGEHAVKSVVFRTRYIHGLKETQQIEYEGEHYEIKGIAEIGRKEGHEITAEVTH